MKYFSAFTGVGGFDIGVPKTWECVGFSEIDNNAKKVLKYRFPEVKNYGDIANMDYGKLPDFDVLLGGSPCQDLSVAGKRAGLAGLRSRLFYSYVAVLKSKKPKYFIFENVKGLLSSNSGWDFADVINNFSEAGYDIWWQLLDATWFGIPQHRERIFVFGTLRGNSIRKIFIKPKIGQQTSKLYEERTDNNSKRYERTESERNGIIENEPDMQIQNMQFDGQERQHNGIYRMGEIKSPTLTYLRKNQHGRIIKEHNDPSYTLLRSTKNGTYDGKTIRYLTPLECERLMGWEDNWTKYGIDKKGNKVEIPDNIRYQLIGNGVVSPIIKVIINTILEERNDNIIEEKPINENIVSIKPVNRLTNFETVE